MSVLAVAAGVAAALLAAYWALTRFVRRAYAAPRIREVRDPGALGLAFEQVIVDTANDKRLFAWYVPAPTTAPQPAPAVAVMHGWGGNAELMLPFAQLLHQGGFAALLVDARGHGRSDADTFASMPRFAEDLERGVDWLARRQEVDARRIALLGHSVGAAACLLLASRRADLAAVISVAAFAHPVTLMRRQMRAHGIPYVPVGWAVLRYIQRVIGVPFATIAPQNTIRAVRCPVLLLHGEADRSVPAADARVIQAAAPAHVQLRLLPDTDHDSVERIECHGDEVIAFLRRALSPTSRPRPA